MTPDKNITSEEILANARETLVNESTALAALAERLSPDFEAVVRLLGAATGRVVVTGIGKSALIAQKIVATFNSTGTPALFMHAADAIHGDLGMIQQQDILLCLSKSGESPEIKFLVPLLKHGGHPLVAMVGHIPSYLSRQADYVLDTTVDKEACPNNLAPTVSTTAQLAMGDALATALMLLKGFTPSDFARFHPGGTLGKKLYLRVGDLAVNNARPAVKPDTPMKEVIVEITAKRLGMTAVLDDNGRVAGIITDGDLRRMLKQHPEWERLTAAAVMHRDPQTISSGAMAVQALTRMRQKDITQLIIEKDGQYEGVVHLHDLLKEGLL